MDDDDVQLSTGLPDVIQVEHVWVIDELHDDDFPLDAEEDLVGPGACFGNGQTGRDNQPLGYDLDGGVFARDGVFGDLYPACGGSAQISSGL